MLWHQVTRLYPRAWRALQVFSNGFAAGVTYQCVPPEPSEFCGSNLPSLVCARVLPSGVTYVSVEKRCSEVKIES